MTEYHPTYAARVRDLSFVGASDKEIARIIGVSTTTLNRWKEQYPDFAMAWEDGKTQADAKVAGALFKRACGFKETKWKETKDGMLREEVHYPPDVKACMFWLTNRRPDMWKNKIEQDGPVGDTLPVDSLSELEAARRIAYALTKATYDRSDIDGDYTRKPETE